jgi:hypothetical protein
MILSFLTLLAKTAGTSGPPPETPFWLLSLEPSVIDLDHACWPDLDRERAADAVAATRVVTLGERGGHICLMQHWDSRRESQASPTEIRPILRWLFGYGVRP